MKWTALVLMIFVLLAIIGSIFYRYTGGNYTPWDLYRDLGFYDANVNAGNVNSQVNANSPLNTNNTNN